MFYEILHSVDINKMAKIKEQQGLHVALLF